MACGASCAANGWQQRDEANSQHGKCAQALTTPHSRACAHSGNTATNWLAGRVHHIVPRSFSQRTKGECETVFWRDLRLDQDDQENLGCCSHLRVAAVVAALERMFWCQIGQLDRFPVQNRVPPGGLEPPTVGLKVRCSAIELEGRVSGILRD